MVGQGSLFWLQNEGGINSGWCISRGKHSHLVRKELCSQPERRTLVGGVEEDKERCKQGPQE
jgi:hypothetical protein